MSPSEVPVPGPSRESFIAVNVREGASRKEILAAIEKALETIDDPYFQYATPNHMNWLRAGSGKDSEPISRGKGLQIMVRHEGP